MGITIPRHTGEGRYLLQAIVMGVGGRGLRHDDGRAMRHDDGNSMRHDVDSLLTSLYALCYWV
jgi:hypothetical protein